MSASSPAAAAVRVSAWAALQQPLRLLHHTTASCDPPCLQPQPCICISSSQTSRKCAPEWKMSAVDFGSRMRMMTAAKRCRQHRGSRRDNVVSAPLPLVHAGHKK